MARPRDHEIDGGLRALAPALDALRAPEPPVALVERALLAARAELLRAPVRAPRPALPAVPPGFGRELARLLAGTAPALALVVLWNALVLRLAAPLLSAWLPEGLAVAALAAYALAALGGLGLVYGSLPFAAHRRALARRREVVA
jgi:hypothetical protein